MSARAPKAVVQRRVNVVYKLLLKGFSMQEIVQYAAERTDWNVGDRQVFKYLARARQMLEAEAKTERAEERGKAVARLNNLFGRALNANDLRQALAVQREINELLSLRDGPREIDGPSAAEEYLGVQKGDRMDGSPP